MLSAQTAAAADTQTRFKPIFDDDGQLIVAAAVATDPPYQADATGKSDASPAIQRAMGDVAAQGGGTLFLPAGRYRLDRHLSVPATVTLCGQWRKPEAGVPLTGTILLAYANRRDAAGPALLAPPECGHANLFNLAIYYPEQDPLRPIPYPFSIDGRVAYVHNITLVNSYQGIMMSNASGSSVAKIYGTVLKRGLVLKGSCELCSCWNVRFGCDYWTRLPEAAMSAAAADAVRKFIMSELIAVQVGKVDGLSLYNAYLGESQTPLLVKKEKDEAKLMIAPWSEYGFGGGLAKVDGRRMEIDFDGWYFRTHYFDLDNYPQLVGKQYRLALPRQAARLCQEASPLRMARLQRLAASDPDAVYQADAFGVQADGATDDRPALQRALDHAGKAGGGVVLLPRGVTVLRASLTIPAGVELRGGYLGVPVRAWYNKLSTLLIDCDADAQDAERAPAAISLQPRAGLRGVMLSHAKNLGELDGQGKPLVHAYPFALRGLGNRIYIRDVIITNAYHGIDLGAVRCDGAQVVGLWGTMFHHGLRVGAGSDGVQLENINIDIGPLESDPRFAKYLPKSEMPSPPVPLPSAGEGSGLPTDPQQVVPVAKRQALLQAYLEEHAVNFVFGDCTGLTTFHLAGFAPHRFLEFVDQGGGGCRDAQFWSSIFDVPQVELARFSGGGPIAFYGLFATGGRDHHSLWAEFDASFHGKVDVFGLCQQLSFNNRPFLVGPDRFEIHLEHSLTTGRPITASSFTAGCAPENAVDGDPRTLWQSADAKGPHTLTVELAGPAVITRWRVHGAGTFLPAVQNMAEAELLGSPDGSSWFHMAGFRDNRHDWVDQPVTCEKPVRWVRLQVVKAEAPATASNRARIAQFDVFGYAVP